MILRFFAGTDMCIDDFVSNWSFDITSFAFRDMYRHRYYFFGPKENAKWVAMNAPYSFSQYPEFKPAGWEMQVKNGRHYTKGTEASVYTAVKLSVEDLEGFGDIDEAAAMAAVRQWHDELDEEDSGDEDSATVEQIDIGVENGAVNTTTGTATRSKSDRSLYVFGENVDPGCFDGPCFFRPYISWFERTESLVLNVWAVDFGQKDLAKGRVYVMVTVHCKKPNVNCLGKCSSQRHQTRSLSDSCFPRPRTSEHR